MASLKKRFEQRIRLIIDNGDRGQWPLTRRMLWASSILFGWAARLRSQAYARRILNPRHLSCKVIAVGNLAAGGTGKTPMVIYVARLLQRSGKKVVLLSRGYGGTAEARGGIVSDGDRILMDPDQAGDEPFMLASRLPGVPVLVGKNRYQSGRAAIGRFNPDVIVLDDAYQHLRLHRDLNLLLLDARQPFGNGYLLPRGKLREPPAHANRADVVVFTRCRHADEARSLIRSFGRCSNVFGASHSPSVYLAAGATPDEQSGQVALTQVEMSAIADASVFAFAGIADNAAFKSTLVALGFNILGFKPFPDHHRYSDQDLQEMVKNRKKSRAYWLATTEKDFYRFHHRLDPGEKLIVVGVDISFGPQKEAFDRAVWRYIDG